MPIKDVEPRGGAILLPDWARLWLESAWIHLYSMMPDAASPLLGFEEEDGTMAEVEVDEVLGLCKRVSASHDLEMIALLKSETVGKNKGLARTMCDEATEVAPNDAMPCCALAAVELE